MKRTGRAEVVALRVVSRRALLGAGLQVAGVAVAAVALGETAGCDDAGACGDFPELTEGPYYVADPAARADITEGLEGTPMTMVLTIQDASCQPLAGAVVDVWHAAPDGTYSGVEGDTGSTYLRGTQVTGDDGVATFTTVVPGWYRGRTTHVHFKVLVDGSEVLTSQAFFPEDALSAVYATGVYAARGDKDTTNAGDGIFQEADDDAVVFAMEGDADAGFTASLTVDVTP